MSYAAELHIRDPENTERMAIIDAALASYTPRTEVFYVKEVDIDLNPRIGFAWHVGAISRQCRRWGRRASITWPCR